MWRSFFLAFGISLFVLGLQSLFLEHVLVPKDTKLQKLVKKILEDDASKVAKSTPAAAVNDSGSARQTSRWQPQNVQNPSPFSVNTGSRFGPSRFAGPAYGTGYGGARMAQPQTRQPAAFRQPNAQFAGFRANTASTTTRKSKLPLQKVYIREWMPWSLLASGAIIFFYTHSWHRRRSHD